MKDRRSKPVCGVALLAAAMLIVPLCGCDAVDSLAAISRADSAGENDVTIQRLERDKGRAVAFSEQEIVVAAERGIEVR